MIKNRLFTVTDINLIDKLKENGITNFVYPLSFFCVGIPNTFDIYDIKENNSYILINRVLDSKSIDKLDKILHNLPSNIKGIIFDDLGIIDLLKDINIEKILFFSHFSTNYESINYMLEYVDTLIVSTDLTFEEYKEISKKVNKKISFFVFGLISSLYSRRTLLDSYNKHYNLNNANQKELECNDKKFIAIQNEFGTVLYSMPYYDGRRLLNINAKYYFYFPILLDKEKVLESSVDNFDNIDTCYGFLDTKTIYKVKRNGGNNL